MSISGIFICVSLSLFGLTWSNWLLFVGLTARKYTSMYIYFCILGQVGGNQHTSKGGGVNYLCLPNDPENGEPNKGGNVQLFGAEYQIDSSYGSSNMVQKEVPCAVCYQRNRSTVLMIPGRNNIKFYIWHVWWKLVMIVS